MEHNAPLYMADLAVLEWEESTADWLKELKDELSSLDLSDSVDNNTFRNLTSSMSSLSRSAIFAGRRSARGNIVKRVTDDDIQALAASGTPPGPRLGLAYSVLDDPFLITIPTRWPPIRRSPKPKRLTEEDSSNASTSVSPVASSFADDRLACGIPKCTLTPSTPVRSKRHKSRNMTAARINQVPAAGH